MSESCIISPFQFKSYKVDKIDFYSKPDLNVLIQMNNIASENMYFGFSFRNPAYFTENKLYVGGFNVSLKVLKDGITLENEEVDDVLIKLEIGIAGVFITSDGNKLPSDQEDELVKISIPALLMPYARSAMTSLLANAGFGASLFPLMNIYELAKEKMKDITIKVID